MKYIQKQYNNTSILKNNETETKMKEKAPIVTDH